MKRNLRTGVLAALFVIFLIPFFLATPAAHPAEDDFTFATYTHPTFVKTGSLLHVVKDALSYTLRTWRDWQGTMTGVFVMAVNPVVFSLESYWIHSVILLVFHLLAWAVFCYHFLGRRIGLPGSLWLQIYLLCGMISLVFLPDITEGIYWFNGAWFYTGAQAWGVLTLVLCDHVAECRMNDRFYLLRILCCLCLFLLGMDNFITAMMCLMGVLTLFAVRLWNEKCRGGQQYSTKTAALFVLPIFLGLVISVIAPGNKVRMATDGWHESGLPWLLRSVRDTLGGGFFYTGRFLIKTPLLAMLLFFTPELMNTHIHRLGEKRIPVPAVLAGYYLIICGMLFPHIYSSGYAGSGRVINMYHDYVILSMPVVLCLCLPGGAERKRIPKWPFRLAALLALILCLALGQEKNYIRLVNDLTDGTQSAYITQFQHEYAICEAADAEEDVVVPVWQVRTLTGKPTVSADPNAWTNEAMADYFEIRSVRTEKNAETWTGMRK